MQVGVLSLWPEKASSHASLGLAQIPVGAALAPNTGKAGAILRVACFAAKAETHRDRDTRPHLRALFLCKPTAHGYHACLIPSRDWHAEVVESPQGWPVPFR
ncbi:hypothetical protein F9Z43_28915 [Pseudomonas monteilii]|uniref:Uncharacterized protein n=1 Tax=Pseudomonas monteilii TaxID=76759 RepID=A0A7X3JUK1_9PSED|nr:hypothetical protein [Pseudomonas monteilii]